jgi:hypothetical protein
LATTVSCRSASRLPDGRAVIVWGDKLVQEWPSVVAMLAEIGGLDDDKEFVRKLFLALAAARSGGNLATFKNLIESKSLTFDLTKANPLTIT